MFQKPLTVGVENCTKSGIQIRRRIQKCNNKWGSPCKIRKPVYVYVRRAHPV